MGAGGVCVELIKIFQQMRTSAKGAGGFGVAAVGHA
jgi:hypothetical protein